MNKNNPIKTHVQFLSAELLSISDRHYFHYNGSSYTLTKEELDKVLNEVKSMNPLTAVKHLIEKVKNNEYKKISK